MYLYREKLKKYADLSWSNNFRFVFFNQAAFLMLEIDLCFLSFAVQRNYVVGVVIVSLSF